MERIKNSKLKRRQIKEIEKQEAQQEVEVPLEPEPVQEGDPFSLKMPVIHRPGERTEGSSQQVEAATQQKPNTDAQPNVS